jgi:hypothetical protein
LEPAKELKYGLGVLGLHSFFAAKKEPCHRQIHAIAEEFAGPTMKVIREELIEYFDDTGDKIDEATKQRILELTENVDDVVRQARDVLINDRALDGGKTQVPRLDSSSAVDKEKFKDNPKQREALRNTSNLLSTPEQPTKGGKPRSSSPVQPTMEIVDEELLKDKPKFIKALQDKTNLFTPVTKKKEKTPHSK